MADILIDNDPLAAVNQCQSAANTATNRAAAAVISATAANNYALLAAQVQGQVGFATCELMYTDLDHAANILALVTNDITRAGTKSYTITTNFDAVVAAGARAYPISTNAAAGDTVIINGITFTAIASGATGNQFNVGVDTTATATNLVTTLNANTTINALYTATSSTNTITLTEKTAGGNTPGAATKTGTIVIGTGTVTTSNPTDTVTIDGVTFTATASTQDTTNFITGSTIAATATNLKTALAANATVNSIYTVTVSGAIITLTETVAGSGYTPADAVTTGTGVISNGTATTSTSNGYWIKIGASGSGSWQKSAYVPLIANDALEPLGTQTISYNSNGTINTITGTGYSLALSYNTSSGTPYVSQATEMYKGKTTQTTLTYDANWIVQSIQRSII